MEDPSFAMKTAPPITVMRRSSVRTVTGTLECTRAVPDINSPPSPLLSKCPPEETSALPPDGSAIYEDPFIAAGIVVEPEYVPATVLQTVRSRRTGRTT
jgi:hypothetical protein